VGGPLHAPYFANIMRIRSALAIKFTRERMRRESRSLPPECCSLILASDGATFRKPLSVLRAWTRRGSNARRNSHYAHSLVHSTSRRSNIARVALHAQLSCV